MAKFACDISYSQLAKLCERSQWSLEIRRVITEKPIYSEHLKLVVVGAGPSKRMSANFVPGKEGEAADRLLARLPANA